jgi:ABC-type enterobactin transport system permease subunit
MRNKQILILFLIGTVLTIAGAIFKILHWPGASLTIIIGMTFEAAAGLLVVYKLSRKTDKKDGFLDS